jgi:hypothetical protein
MLRTQILILMRQALEFSPSYAGAVKKSKNQKMIELNGSNLVPIVFCVLSVNKLSASHQLFNQLAYGIHLINFYQYEKTN